MPPLLTWFVIIELNFCSIVDSLETIEYVFMIAITLSIKKLDKTSIKYISWISLYYFNLQILIICFWFEDNLFIHI